MNVINKLSKDRINSIIHKVIASPTDEQMDAILKGLKNEDLLVYGEAGTGKTQVLKVLYRILTAARLNVLVVVPTATAANNFKHEDIPAVTIHSAFKIINVSTYMDDDEVFKPILGEKLSDEYDVLIVDEISMVGESLYNIIREQFTNKVIWAGDKFQLAPVKDKIVKYEEIIKNKAELTINFRAGSPAIKRLIADFREFIIDGGSLDLNNYVDNKDVKVVADNKAAIVEYRQFQVGLAKPKDKRYLSYTNQNTEMFIEDLAKAYGINTTNANPGDYMALSPLSMNYIYDGEFYHETPIVNGDIIRLEPLEPYVAAARRRNADKKYIFLNLSVRNNAYRFLVAQTGISPALYKALNPQTRQELTFGISDDQQNIPYLIAMTSIADVKKWASQASATRWLLIDELDKVIPGFKVGITKVHAADKKKREASEVSHVEEYTENIIREHGHKTINFMIDGQYLTVKETFGFLRHLKATASQIIHIRYVSGMTIHKSQGQSIPLVLMDSTSNKINKLWYVAVSRAINKIVFVGKPPVLTADTEVEVEEYTDDEDFNLNKLPSRSGMYAPVSYKQIK